MSGAIMQPIIRGIQAVGSVKVSYIYNSTDGKLPIPPTIKLGKLTGDDAVIETAGGIDVAGFRLDAEFLRANPQVASSFVIPILGGGGVALTNNNRTGTLHLVCTKVSTPVPGKGDEEFKGTDGGPTVSKIQATGSMYSPSGSAIGVYQADQPYYDMVTLAQIQQAQTAGDAVGSTITISFVFCGLLTQIAFEGCTIATVDPIGLAGNNAVDYNIAINYLNWVVDYSDTGTIYAVPPNSDAIAAPPGA